MRGYNTMLVQIGCTLVYTDQRLLISPPTRHNVPKYLSLRSLSIFMNSDESLMFLRRFGAPSLSQIVMTVPLIFCSLRLRAKSFLHVRLKGLRNLHHLLEMGFSQCGHFLRRVSCLGIIFGYSHCRLKRYDRLISTSYRLRAWLAHHYESLVHSS